MRFARALTASGYVLGICALLRLGGCIAQITPAPPPPDPVAIELVNQTGYVLDANFFISATATDATSLFVPGNKYTDYTTRPSRTMEPNGSASFELDCDLVAALGVLEPVFSNEIGIGGGRSTDQIFRLRDQEYDCGSRLRFTYYVEADVFHVRVEAL
ncbi:MAG: hypothetical protein KKB50_20785 [Planctomycetes bacterium]|nr:hypothetical protein [Planctomycetota bacterium]